MAYEELLIESDSLGLIVNEKPLKANYGRIKGKRIAIKKDLFSDTEKACVLAEELGHYHTTTGDILDQSKAENRKQERRARSWAYRRLVPLDCLINAFEASIVGRHNLSEYIGVTESFLQDAIGYYHDKYGLFVEYGIYMIYFNPLGIMKKIE